MFRERKVTGFYFKRLRLCASVLFLLSVLFLSFFNAFVVQHIFECGVELWFILASGPSLRPILNLISELICHAFLLSEYIIHTHWFVNSAVSLLFLTQSPISFILLSLPALADTLCCLYGAWSGLSSWSRSPNGPNACQVHTHNPHTHAHYEATRCWQSCFCSLYLFSH